jgi:hypothetical protein
MSDYSGEVVEIEVARYGLRTFRHVSAYEASMSSNERWIRDWQSITLGIYGSDLFGVSKPEGPMELCSTAMSGSHWKTGVCEASCQQELNSHQRLLIELAALTTGVEPVYAHQAPQEDCHCGIYAAHTLAVLRDQFSDYVSDIVAVVAAEGQTIIGDKGFRTQRARVVAYWCSDRVADTAESQFAEAQRYPEIAPMLAEYGLEDGGHTPEELYKFLLDWTPSPGIADKPSSGRKRAVGANLAASATNATLFYLSPHSWLCLVMAVVSLAAAFYFLVVMA